MPTLGPMGPDLFEPDKSIKKLFQRQKRGQFEAESVLGDGQSRTGGIALEDIVRSGTVRNLGVRNRCRTRLSFLIKFPRCDTGCGRLRKTVFFGIPRKLEIQHARV